MSKRFGSDYLDKYDKNLNNWEESEFYYSDSDEDEKENEDESRKRKRA